MASAICHDGICSGRVELSLTEDMLFFYSIFSTNGCYGTHFLDVDGGMHKLKTNCGKKSSKIWVDKIKKKIYTQIQILSKNWRLNQS